MRIKFISEDIPQEANQVGLGDTAGAKPKLHFSGYSSYNQRAVDSVQKLAEKLVKGLPVTRIAKPKLNKGSEAHILGTARMGTDPKTSVVDGHMVHHRYRNLAVLGSSSFPTSSPANPTLTICALSLRAGKHLFGKGI
jgi:choline dehydrogenase-like flavoprotein